MSTSLGWDVKPYLLAVCPFILIDSKEKGSCLEMCLITLYFQLSILRKMVGSSSQCIWISWPDHMPFAAFQWKNDNCPSRRWAHLTWDLMECEKITVSYLSLNKHIYEIHTFLNEQLELLLVILWSLFLTFSATVSLAVSNVEWTLQSEGWIHKILRVARTLARVRVLRILLE